MGLDMYLYANKYVSGNDWVRDSAGNLESKVSEAFSKMLESAGLEAGDLQTEYPSGELKIQVAYWRKVNAIHGWFVDTCGNGVDECQPYDVDIDHLGQLLREVKKVLETRDPSLLPPVGGFFFGSTEVDEYYWSDLEATRDMLTAILDNPKFADWEFSYRASW